MVKIKSIEDVFHLFGVDYEDRTIEEKEALLSRRIYKGTGCGAWARIVHPGEGYNRNRERWHAFVSLSLCGPRVRFVRKDHGKTMCLAAAPKEIAQYLEVKDDRGTMGVTSDFLNERVEHGAELTCGSLEHIKKRRVGWYITFDVKVERTYATPPGVLFGSIVEGSDVCIDTDPLYFPFNEKEIWDTIQYIEDEASAEWYAANVGYPVVEVDTEGRYQAYTHHSESLYIVQDCLGEDGKTRHRGKGDWKKDKTVLDFLKWAHESSENWKEDFDPEDVYVQEVEKLSKQTIAYM